MNQADIVRATADVVGTGHVDHDEPRQPTGRAAVPTYEQQRRINQAKERRAKKREKAFKRMMRQQAQRG